MRKLLLAIVSLSASFLLPLPALAALQVTLTPSVASPQPVGTAVNLTAAASDSNPGTLTYRYSISYGGVTRIVRDFSQDNSFDWAGAVSDGRYVVQVTARNNTTQQTAQKSMLFQLTSRASGATPVVTASANPLVALLSAPACQKGNKMRVRFGLPGGAFVVTDWRACNPPSSMNIYVAGMRANTRYVMAAQTIGRGGITTSPAVSFTTGDVPANIPVVVPVVPANSHSSLADKVLVSGFVGQQSVAVAYPEATDLSGNPLWYYAAFNDPTQTRGLLTRVLPGGTMLVLANGVNSQDATTQLQILREIDLAGNSLRETNATRIREQLNAMGLVSNCTVGGSICAVTAFHHDAIRLPNGHTLVLGTEERMYPTGTQGATSPVDILGDVVVDLDENLQVAWFWDAFPNLDVNRAAILGETCAPGLRACPPLFLAPIANDWLHCNSIQYTTDHNLIISMRHQDWVIKVDYQDGTGDGHVIWRLGAGGDFSIVSNDPYPWFSHQHEAAFESDGTFSVFDNGNTRVADNPGTVENSRGQIYQIDENSLTATLLVNSDLGVYSSALGSAQLLSNGNYHFLSGHIDSGPPFSQSIEVLPDGTINSRLQAAPPAYRSFRMPSLYAPPSS
ncbi:MAG: aryl-sulfate sulfotransferase [Proteobacteria bacterium]|nr:aryl-sulfate sulfotransferase [Pseudomonadota bacterium]